ncbi:MAG: response regulator [Lachnospiraceae bacterium]|nr:response regulator [Lachnospiraceae bacterium]
MITGKIRIKTAVILAIMAFITVYAFISGAMAKEYHFDDQLRCTGIDEGWEQLFSDGRREPVKLPSSLDTEEGLIVLEGTLPVIRDDGMYISVYCLQQDMALFIDDEPRACYVDGRTVTPPAGHLKARTGRPSANVYVFAGVNASDSGKKVRIEYFSTSFFNRNAGEVFIGDQLGIWQHYFDRKIFLLTAILTMTVIAAIAAFMLILYSVRTQNRMNLSFLLTGVFMIGLWKFLDNPIDNPFRQFIFIDSPSIQNAAYVIEYFMIIPVLCYVDGIQKKRYHRLFAIEEWVMVASGATAAALDTFRILYLSQYEPILIASVIISVLSIFISVFLDFRKHLVHEYRMIVHSLIFLSLTAVTEVLALYFPAFSGFSGSAVYGIMVVMVTSILYTCVELSLARAETTAAVRSSEEGKRFLSGMSHGIRTPVNTILGMNEMIRRDSSNKQVLEYSTDIANAGNTLVSLIDDIIDFTKMETGKLEINEAPYQPASLFNDICVLTERIAEDKKLEFRLDISPDIPSGLVGDVSRIRQIMLNIMSNAIKYTSKGRVTLKAWGNENKDGYLFCFSVTDTGAGIKSDDIDHIFDAYSRVDESANARIEGTGLGLTITKRLTDSMRGEISADSIYGSGSVFTVKLPQKISDHRPIGEFRRSSVSRTRDEDSLASFRAQGKRLLAVDDNTTNLMVLRGLLKRSRMRIDVTTSGSEALKMLAQNDYDLVFMDHMMPEQDGVETLKILKSDENNRNYSTPVVVLTANVISGAEQMYMDAGFAAYLSKPIAPAKLAAILQQYLY